MKSIRKAFTIVEILVVIFIILLLGALLSFVIWPAAKQSAYQRTCASNMKQIVTAVQLYTADNDGMAASWTSRQMASYLKIKIPQLYCPKATLGISGKKVTSYSDLVGDAVASYNTPKLRAMPRLLPNGQYAPWFDVEHDAILKCTMHGSAGYQTPSDSRVVMLDETNLRGKQQSVYLDGHVAQAYTMPCWELPFHVNSTTYEQHPELIQMCDGTLEDKK